MYDKTLLCRITPVKIYVFNKAFIHIHMCFDYANKTLCSILYHYGKIISYLYLNTDIGLCVFFLLKFFLECKLACVSLRAVNYTYVYTQARNHANPSLSRWYERQKIRYTLGLTI